MAIQHRLRLAEVPVRMREREHGRSSIRGLRIGLLHGEGDARDRDRLAAAPGDADGGRVIASGQTPLAVSIAATAASLLLLLVVFELIRSRRLRERYALLWLADRPRARSSSSAWRGGLNTIAGWFGVQTYPPAVLFAVGLLFVILVLLHYSTVISRLADQNVDPGPAARAARARAQCSVGAGARRPAGRSRGTRSASELSTSCRRRDRGGQGAARRPRPS